VLLSTVQAPGAGKEKAAFPASGIAAFDFLSAGFSFGSDLTLPHIRATLAPVATVRFARPPVGRPESFGPFPMLIYYILRKEAFVKSFC